MSEPQRKSFREVTEGQEPGSGIADPATVEGGTIGAGEHAAHASEEQVDPAGYPHEPARAVPPVPTDAGDADDARTGGQDGSRGPGPE